MQLISKIFLSNLDQNIYTSYVDNMLLEVPFAYVKVSYQTNSTLSYPIYLII